MTIVCLVNDVSARDGEHIIPAAEADWNKLRRREIRIICRGFESARSTIRAACAHDCYPIDVLDVGNIDYAIVTYDNSKHRKFKREHDIPICRPLLMPMPTAYAAGLVRQYEAK